MKLLFGFNLAFELPLKLHSVHDKPALDASLNIANNLHLLARMRTLPAYQCGRRTDK